MMTIEDLEIVAGCINIVVGKCRFETQYDYIHVDRTYRLIKVLHKKHWLCCMRRYDRGFYIKQKE